MARRWMRPACHRQYLDTLPHGSGERIRELGADANLAPRSPASRDLGAACAPCRQRWRTAGTSRREDILDTVLSLKRPDDYDPSEGARFEVHFEKSRGNFGEEAAPFEARLEVRDGDAIWTMREIEDVKLARAQVLFAEGSTVRDVAEELSISKSAAGRLKKKIEGQQ
jgi:hypothetical protein